MLDHLAVAPEMELLQDLLTRSSAAFPYRIAILTQTGNYTYSELVDLARRYAACLRNAGAVPGDRIALLMENGEEYVSAYFGTFLAGCVAVPLDFNSPPSSLVAILNDCGVRGLIVTPRQVRSGLETLADNLNGCFLITLSGEHSSHPHHINWLTVDSQAPELIEVRAKPTNPAVIIYTSGTSGNPKGVVMSHGAILANTRSIVTYLELTQTDRMMQILPFFYCYGASLLHTHFMVGGSIVVDNRFLYPSAVLANMKETRCTGFAGVPSTFHTLASKCDLQGSQYPDLRYLTQAGGRLDPKLAQRIRTAVLPARLFLMYGQTEASARISYLDTTRWPDKLSSVGTAIPGVSLRIVSEERVDVPQGQPGEVWVKGENLMTGYWGQSEETEQVLIDGWLRTGDIGKLDEDGCLFIEGRIREIIKSHGYRISPREIEEVLLHHPSVNEAAVLGTPDLQAGELVAAVLSLHEGETLTERDLIDYCRQSLPPHKIPKLVALVPELPKSTSGKLQRNSLRSLFDGRHSLSMDPTWN